MLRQRSQHSVCEGGHPSSRAGKCVSARAGFWRDGHPRADAGSGAGGRSRKFEWLPSVPLNRLAAKRLPGASLPPLRCAAGGGGGGGLGRRRGACMLDKAAVSLGGRPHAGYAQGCGAAHVHGRERMAAERSAKQQMPSCFQPPVHTDAAARTPDAAGPALRHTLQPPDPRLEAR